jgi:hypothetical protein
MIDVESEVRRWARDLLGASATVSPLSGGGNNHLFRCTSADRSIVVKRYREQNFGAGVSRSEAEVAFLRYAAEAAALSQVPRLVATHEELEMIAMTAIDGTPYQAGQAVSAEDLRAAVLFYRGLNSHREHLRAYPVAAREGFLSILEHLRHIEERLSNLCAGHLPTEVRAAAQRVLNGLTDEFTELAKSVQPTISAGSYLDTLDPDLQQISPGDFGFHNAIKTEAGPVFIDFEYAGKDDPAKTLADFFLQPKLPIDPSAFDAVGDALAITVPREYLKDRARVLGRILFIKWKMIILAPLDQDRFTSFESRYQDALIPEVFNRLRLAERKSLFN